MNRMKEELGTAACLIVAVLLLSAFAPTVSGAVSVDAVAFEVNKPDIQVAVWMPLRAAGCDYLREDARKYFVCDIHLGKSGGHAGKKILRRELITTERYTMLLTVTGEERPLEHANTRVCFSADLDLPCFARRMALKVAGVYSRVTAFFLRALVAVIRGQVS